MSERNKIVYQDWTFVDKDIQSGSVYLAMSLMSDQLEANTFTATVNCTDKTIINFERNAPLTYYNSGQQKGIFYVQSITRMQYRLLLGHHRRRRHILPNPLMLLLQIHRWRYDLMRWH
jgi:hypothetical protein